MSTDDTHPDARREQTRLLREAGPTRRFEAAAAMTMLVRHLSYEALCRRMPDADDRERRIAWARQLYGERLIRQLGVDGDDA